MTDTHKQDSRTVGGGNAGTARIIASRTARSKNYSEVVNMTAKQYLQQIRSVDMRINRKLDQIEALKSTRERTTATLTGMPRVGGASDPLTTITARIWDLEREINEDIDLLIELKRDIQKRINAIEDQRYKAILEARYLSYSSWEEIAKDLGDVDTSWLLKLHGRALVEFEKISKNFQKAIASHS